MKKMIYFMGMFLLFSTPTLVHAEETDLSTISDEQMLQELNNRFSAEKNEGDVVKEVTAQNQVNKEINIAKINNDDLISFTEQVDTMSLNQIDNLIEKYAFKTELTDFEKEKVEILNEQKNQRLNEINTFYIYRNIIFLIVLVVGLGVFIGGALTH